MKSQNKKKLKAYHLTGVKKKTEQLHIPVP